MATSEDIDYNRADKATLSNYADVVSEHLHFEWDIDFDAKELSGSVTHSMKMLRDGVGVVELDTSKLTVLSASINGENSSFTVADAYRELGNKLTIAVPEHLRLKDSFFDVKIEYTANSSASAMQWLDAASTKGGEYPYLFTQCQAIHARSMFPCQDTPGVKATYSAEVTAPEWCTVLMSALSDNSMVSAVNKGVPGVFGWSQPVPTCAYLVAIAAGNLESRDISKRVRVWSEPEMIEAVAFEFSETEEFLKAAEGLTCDYQWTRYDVLCLPPSFPYGGMENPCLTFATPTLLAGDRSLADVIAHEIAHSWTGNLVTNATWEHFWLNEGWTVWLERKISAKVRGSDEFFKLSATNGWKTLVDSVNGFGKEHEYTKLVRAPTDDDPDESFSSIPYEKGFNLLFHLETLIGSPTFMKFAKSYIAKFQFSTVTSGEFKDYFVEYVRTNGDDAQKSAVQSINWDHIFHNAGMPIHTPDFSTSLKDGPLELAARWIEAADNDVSGFSQADRSGWVTLQNNIFLDKLLESASKKPLSAEKLENMNKIYDFGSVNNCEIKFRWQCLCLSTGVTWIVYAVVTFVKSQGRMKYVRPLYRALNACSKVNGSKIAKTTFIEAYSMYHPIAQKMLANDLSVTAEEIAAASPPVPTLPPKETLTVKSNAVKTSIKVGILRLKNWCFSTWPRLASATGVVAAFSYIFFKRLFKK